MPYAHRRAIISTTLATGVLTAVLAASLTGCGSGQRKEGAAAADPNAPTATGQATGTPSTSEESTLGGRTPDTTFKTADPELYPDVTARYGTPVAAKVTDQALTVLTETTYADAVITAAPPAQQDVVAALADLMTTDSDAEWRGIVKRHAAATTNEQLQHSKVFTLAFWGLLPQEGLGDATTLPPADGPVVINPEVRRVQTWLVDDGRIAVKVKVAVDLRMLLNDKPRVLGATGTHRLWYKQVNGAWLLDGWNSGLKFADHDRKDPYAS